MMMRIQKLPRSVSIIFTLLAFLNGWKEVILVLFVIRSAPMKQNFHLFCEWMKGTMFDTESALFFIWCRRWFSILLLISSNQKLTYVQPFCCLNLSLSKGYNPWEFSLFCPFLSGSHRLAVVWLFWFWRNHAHFKSIVSLCILFSFKLWKKKE